MRRTPPAALLAVAAALAAGLPLLASGAGPAYDLPNLVSDPPEGAYLQRYSTDHHGVGLGDRLLMRFDGHVHNAGTGPLDVQGNPSNPDPATGGMAQWVQPAGGGALVPWSYAGQPAPVFEYTGSDSHNHWHLRRIAEYSLWDAAMTAPVKPGDKVGFCLYDIQRMEPTGPATPLYDGVTTGDFCRRNAPAATSLREGISAGWRDTYEASLAYQWVDVSDVRPGRYRLANRADPDDVVRESDETDNGAAFSAGEVVVPGHVAQPAGPVTTSSGRSVVVALSAVTHGGGVFGTPGPRRFRIRSLPAHGTLSHAGTALAAGDVLPSGVAAVTYTGAPGATGADGFTYSAEDERSPFPTDGTGVPQAGAVVAPATVVVGAYVPVVVAVGGAPARLAPGATAALTATVTGAGPAVDWRVEGVGSVTAAGRYTVPAGAREGTVVTVRATSREDTSASGVARITVGRAVPRTPAPSPGSVLTPGMLLTPPGVMVARGRHVVTVQVAVAGRVVITAERGGRRLAGCATPLAALQRFSCAMRLPDTAGVRVVARLVAADGRRAVRRLPLAAAEGLGVLRARRSGGVLTLAVTATRPGAVRVQVRRHGRVVSRCAGRVVAGQVFTCGRPVRGAGPVQVLAWLRGDGFTTLRRATAR